MYFFIDPQCKTENHECQISLTSLEGSYTHPRYLNISIQCELVFVHVKGLPEHSHLQVISRHET